MCDVKTINEMNEQKAKTAIRKQNALVPATARKPESQEKTLDEIERARLKSSQFTVAKLYTCRVCGFEFKGRHEATDESSITEDSKPICPKALSRKHDEVIVLQEKLWDKNIPDSVKEGICVEIMWLRACLSANTNST
jgi:hypothetical protein